MPYKVEHTDTFGGEANYCWVNRAVIRPPENASQRQIVQAAKAAIGETGAKCRTEAYGDGYRLHYVGRCVTTFVDWIDDDEAAALEGE